MSKLQNRIDEELKDFTFDCSTELYKARYKSRRKKATAVCAMCCIALICLAGGAMLSGIIDNDNIIKNPPAATESTNIEITNCFIVTAYAANTTNESSTAMTEIANDSLLTCNMHIWVTNEIEHNGKTYKQFEITGDSRIGVKGENIKSVSFTSATGGFYDQKSKTTHKSIEINKSDQNGYYLAEWDNSRVSAQMEKQSEPGYIFSFSDIPHDTVTITVTFNDNTVQSKILELYFNESGYLVINSGKNVYNNGSKTQPDIKWSDDGVFGTPIYED